MWIFDVLQVPLRIFLCKFIFIICLEFLNYGSSENFFWHSKFYCRKILFLNQLIDCVNLNNKWSESVWRWNFCNEKIFDFMLVCFQNFYFGEFWTNFNNSIQRIGWVVICKVINNINFRGTCCFQIYFARVLRKQWTFNRFKIYILTQMIFC